MGQSINWKQIKSEDIPSGHELKIGKEDNPAKKIVSEEIYLTDSEHGKLVKTLNGKLVNAIQGEDFITTEDIDAEDGVTIDEGVIKTKFSSELDPNLATIQVGGLAPTTIGELSEKSLRNIIEDMVAPTISPTYTIPTLVLTLLVGNTSVKEFGSSITMGFQLVGVKNDAGNYFELQVRRNNSIIHTSYTATQSSTSNVPPQFGFNSPNNPNIQFLTTHTDEYTINVIGNVTYNGLGKYLSGLPKNNNKGVLDDRVPSVRSVNAPQANSNDFSSNNITFVCTYPYYYLKSFSPITPEIMQSAISNGTATKVVAVSTGTITIPFNANGEYLSFAYPSTSTTKTIWYVTPLNQGQIPGGVFGAATTINCTSANGFWSDVPYKIHTTAGLITEPNPIEMRNS